MVKDGTAEETSGCPITQTIAHPSGRPMYLLEDLEPVLELL